MPDFNPQVLHTMRQNLAGMGKDHLNVGANGGMRTTTTGATGRFFGRMAALLSGDRATANRAGIDHFLRQLETLPEAGAGLAASVRNGMGQPYKAGKPLTARTATGHRQGGD